MIAIEMAPKTEKEPMEQVSLQVPTPMLRDVDALAKSWGLSRNDVCRQAIAEGLPALFRRDNDRIARENKLLVNAKLKRHPEFIKEAIERLEAVGADPEIVALLRQAISG
jgi:Arc/MetJ-type ribon-helix-helix transcriptional regulator